MNPPLAAAPLPMIGLGVVLLAHAIRTLTPARGPRVPSALLSFSIRVARRTDLLRRRADADLLATRLASAPRAWPARAIAAAAHHTRDAPTFADAIAGIRLLSAVCLGSTAAAVCAPLGATAAVTAGTLGAFAGAVLPDLALARAARRSLGEGRRDTARTVDLLAAAISAGRPLRDALDTTANHAPPALAAALRSAAVRLSTGIDPPAAFAAESTRFDIPILADVGDAADRQRRLGFPLGPELCQIAARHRAEARADLLARAARRAPLGTLVVALVIAPVCIAALTACLVGGLVMSGGLSVH